MCDYPYAEHVEFLEGKVPKERYEELSAQADQIVKTTGNDDLDLTEKEVTLLRESYAEGRAKDGFSDLVYARTEVKGSKGTVEFETFIGCDGWACESRSPYETRDGNGLDLSEYVELGD